VFEADIKACFDEISHAGLMDSVRARIGDRRVLGWVKAFLRAGILTEEGVNRETTTLQGGILSPLMADSLLRREQPDDQCSVGRACRPEPGSADNRPGKRLPGTVYEGEAGGAEGARQASCDHDRFGEVPVEQRSRRRGSRLRTSPWSPREQVRLLTSKSHVSGADR
jgi:hypothetical protein